MQEEDFSNRTKTSFEHFPVPLAYSLPGTVGEIHSHYPYALARYVLLSLQLSLPLAQWQKIPTASTKHAFQLAYDTDHLSSVEKLVLASASPNR
jgi:hypothetical protein